MTDPLFQAFLAQHDDGAWHRAADRLRLAMHPVDRAAPRIWLHFFPLRLQRALDTSPDAASLAHHLRLAGRWRLADQRDTSHWFLYGHRYWPAVRDVVRQFAARPVAPGSLDLGAQILEMARAAASRLAVDASWLVGITVVAVRTLQQAGLPESDIATPAGGTGPLIGVAGDNPDRLAARREANDSQGMFGFLRGGRRQWTVTFDERPPRRGFRLIETQHLTTAAALDRRHYRGADQRCTEGPIPTQCRTCSCGACWVGILAGAAKLSPVDGRERTALAAFGYSDTREPHPDIRLACMAETRGAVTIVIPPWNGQVGERLEAARRRG